LAVNAARWLYTDLTVAGQLGVGLLQLGLGAHGNRRNTRQSRRQCLTSKRRLVINPFKGVQVQSTGDQLQPRRFELATVRFINLTHAPGQHHLDLMGPRLLDDPVDAFLIVLRLAPGDIGQPGNFRATLSV